MTRALTHIDRVINHEIEAVGVRNTNGHYDTIIFFQLNENNKLECWECWNGRYFKSIFDWHDKFFDWKFDDPSWIVVTSNKQK